MANAKKPGEVPASEAPFANSDPKRTSPGSDAPAPQKPADKPKASSKMKYFKSRLHGLSVVVRQDPPEENADPTTAIEKIRFQPFYENVDGDNTKVGYLATDNAKALKALAADPGVEELTKDEYDKATDTERQTKPARRAPY